METSAWHFSPLVLHGEQRAHPTTTRAVRAAVIFFIPGWNCFKNPLQMRGKIKSAPGLLLSAVKSVSGPVNCVDIQWQCAKSTLHQDVTTDLAILTSRPVYFECWFYFNYLFILHSCDTLLCVYCNFVVTDSKMSCRLMQQWEVQQSFKQPFHSMLYRMYNIECICHHDSFQSRWSSERLVAEKGSETMVSPVLTSVICD